MDAQELPEVVLTPPEDLPDGAIVQRFHSAREAHEWGLVILSARVPYWVHVHDGVFYLMVRRGDVDLVSPQLQLYARERGNWPPRVTELPSAPITRDSLWLVAVLVLVMFTLSAQYPVLLQGGRVDSIAVVQGGQWWRTVTALWLHADIVHLLGNLLAGGVFVFFVLRYFGYGLGWFAVGLAGALGNSFNSWLYYPNQHLSIGASTAVFAAVGILAAFPLVYAWRQRSQPSAKQSLVPLLGGAVLLAWLGTGDARTDVFAHLWGFAAGIVLTVLCLMLPEPARSDRWQPLWACLAAVLHAGAWILAVTVGG